MFVFSVYETVKRTTKLIKNVVENDALWPKFRVCTYVFVLGVHCIHELATHVADVHCVCDVIITNILYLYISE